MPFGRKAAAPATPLAFAWSGQPAAPELTPRTADLATLCSNGALGLRVEARRGRYGFARRQAPSEHLFPTLTAFALACVLRACMHPFCVHTGCRPALTSVFVFGVRVCLCVRLCIRLQADRGRRGGAAGRWLRCCAVARDRLWTLPACCPGRGGLVL